MPEKISLTEQEAEIYAHSLNIVYEEMGLQQAIFFLFRMLNMYFHITRIFAGFREIESPVFYPLADTSELSQDLTVIRHGSYNTPDEKKIFIRRDSLEPYFPDRSVFPEECKHVNGIGRPEDYISHIRIPLFFQAERVFQIGVCSDKEHVFHEKDLNIMKIITKHLSRSLLVAEGKAKNTKLEELVNQNSIELLTMCKGLSSLLKDIKKVAKTEYSALIEGETGVGKDLIAQSIHGLSARKDKSFIKINCGAISESLLESELFGYEKGAFTGANTSRKGYFEEAEGGSLFLDEIGELSLKLQSSLLRAVENKCIQRVGSTKEINIDVRIIAATNRNLEERVTDGEFRADLWYRLNVFPLKVPPLRSHREDIDTLVEYFTCMAIKYLKITNYPLITKFELNKLFNHSWPGNVRELKNVVDRAIVNSCEGHYCYPLQFDINYQERSSVEHVQKKFISMKELCINYAKEVLDHTKGKITGKDGAASILQLHPNTVRQYKDRM